MTYKPLELPTIMGVNLNEVNLKMVAIVVIAGLLLPSYTLTPIWDAELVDIREGMKGYQEEQKTLDAEIKTLKHVEEQINDLKSQEDRLKEKLNVVRKIIKTRKTPINILMYIAKNIPDDLWLSSIEIEQNKFKLEGKSLSFTSVGKFVGALRSSIFFNKDLRMSATKAKEEKETGVRLETFGITATIGRFE